MARHSLPLPAFTGNAFGTTHLNTVVFKKGSAFTVRMRQSFGAMAPTAVTIFREGSHYYQQQAVGLSLGAELMATCKQKQISISVIFGICERPGHSKRFHREPVEF
jgi:hypothetical protein